MIENITVTKKVQKRQEIVKPPDGRFEKYLEYLQRTDGFRDSEIDYVRSEISKYTHGGFLSIYWNSNVMIFTADINTGSIRLNTI